MDNKDFDSIMKEITSGFTGDNKADIKYLQEQMEVYKDHEYGKEIIRACGRMMYELMPEDMKKELSAVIDKDEKGFDAALEEIRFCILKKEYDTALKLMEAMVAKYEDLDMYADDEVSEYYDFQEIFEEILFKHIYKPEKEVRRAQIRYGNLYMQYGSLLIDLKRYEDAAAALEKGMKWNPIYAKIAFEHAETYKLRGMVDDFYNATKEVFKIAMRPEELARCYRNLGYYYVEKEEYQVAACCDVFSLQFEQSNMAQSELFYISTRQKDVNVAPEIEMIKQCFSDNDIPFGPDEDILGMAYQLTKMSIEQKNKEASAYFISILLRFFENEELKEMVDEINNM